MHLIERCFQISPDGGDGLFEFVLIVGLIICIAIGLFRSDLRRLLRREQLVTLAVALLIFDMRVCNLQTAYFRDRTLRNLPLRWTLVGNNLGLEIALGQRDV